MTQATDQIQKKIEEISTRIDEYLADKRALEKALTIWMQDIGEEVTRIESDIKHEVRERVPIVALAITALKVCGNPLPLKELCSPIQQQGSPSSENTITTGLYRAAKRGMLEIVEKGMFGLPEWNGDNSGGPKPQVIIPLVGDGSDVIVSK